MRILVIEDDKKTATFLCNVLFLTARDGVPDRVKGLELGGDDYLTKPFAFSELLARIGATQKEDATEPVWENPKAENRRFRRQFNAQVQPLRMDSPMTSSGSPRKSRWLNATVLGIGLSSLLSDSSHEIALDVSRRQ